jgi:hypothetical protein
MPQERQIDCYINSAQYPALSWDPTLEIVREAFRVWERAVWGNVRVSFPAGPVPQGFCSDGSNGISFGDPLNQVSDC